ncbi:MAG: hypothetical protein WBQ32_10475 [Ignavibacteriaceae bacterium]
MLNFTKKIFLLYLVFNTGQSLHAQTFGFGCLGFVGGYGGFTYQKFNPVGFNEYIREFNLTEFVNTPVDEFSYAVGYRFGLNFFRATFENGIIVTAKGYYQSINKKNKGGVGIGQSEDNYSLELSLKNWSLGFDVGWEFTKVVSWKILDGSLNFNNVTLTRSIDLPGEPTSINKYESDAGVIGYSIGTGVIVAILKDYISVEGLAGYTYLQINNVYNSDESPTSFLETYNINNKFIDSGGFTAVIQLNVGFPLL